VTSRKRLDCGRRKEAAWQASYAAPAFFACCRELKWLTVTPAERERMNLLAMLIQCERDHQKYLEYVREINELMNQKEKRLAEAERSARQDSTKPKSS